jgi:membrane-associated phospholipid phosphatase
MLTLLLVGTLVWAPASRHAADVASTVTVSTQIGLDTLASLRAPDRRCALLHQGLRLGLVVGLSELVKHVVHRTRPDGSDRQSFWSEHTALAAGSRGWSVGWSVPLTLGTGYLRVAANKHYISDVVAGALVGDVVARLVTCPSGES